MYGLLVVGEVEVGEYIVYGMFDIFGVECLCYVGCKVLVVGVGYLVVGNLFVLVMLVG